MAQPPIKNNAISDDITAGDVAGFTIGETANNLVRLNGSAQLTPVDASLLTNIPSDPTSVAKTGDTMTGDLVIGDGVDGNTLHLRGTAGNNDAHVWFRRDDNTAAGILFSNTGSDTFRLQKYALNGSTVQGFLQIENNGNVSISASAPTNIDHLTRKDYVDNTTVSLSGDTMTGSLTLESSPEVSIVLHETDAPVDSGRWDIVATSSLLAFRTLNDAHSAASTALTISRNANQVTDVSIINPTTPTSGLHITNKDYVDAQVAAAGSTTLAGVVNTDGTLARGTAGVTTSNIIVGQYRITHNLGHINYAVALVVGNSHIRNAVLDTIVNSTFFDVTVYTVTTGAAVNSLFHFQIVTW